MNNAESTNMKDDVNKYFEIEETRKKDWEEFCDDYYNYDE